MVDGMSKELTVHAMVHLVMAEAAKRHEVAADRISLVDALRLQLDSNA